jgi:predicted nuclease with TOPRIM domain
VERLTIPDAANLLGISEAAVRQRIRRGRIQFDKDGERTYVYVTPEETQELLEDNLSRDSALLFQSMQDQIDTLKQELAIRNEELRRKDHLLAALTERIPAIEAPVEQAAEPRESAVSASETQATGDVPHDSAEGESRQSWWSRLFRA